MLKTPGLESLNQKYDILNAHTFILWISFFINSWWIRNLLKRDIKLGPFLTGARHEPKTYIWDGIEDLLSILTFERMFSFCLYIDFNKSMLKSFYRLLWIDKGRIMEEDRIPFHTYLLIYTPLMGPTGQTDGRKQEEMADLIL